MKFPLSKLNVKEYQDKIYQLIQDDNCKIYIDTNIIALFYGIHDSARKEFFDWLKILIGKDRVKVPVWVINEYTNRFIRNQIQDYLSPLKKVSTLKKEFEQVSAFLKMHIEDSNLNHTNYSTAADFQNDLKEIQDKFEKITFAAKNKDEKYKLKIHDEINQVLGSCIIDSNIDGILSSTITLGAIRYDHKLPPGFQDGKKDLNAHGDLILWYEILNHCKEKDIKKAILVTDDEKKDWVYAPNKLVRAGKELSNNKPQFKIADPRLIHEFQVTTGSEEFYIISFELLTQILIENISNSFTNLAGALQLVHNQTDEEGEEENTDDSIKENSESTKGQLSEEEDTDKNAFQSTDEEQSVTKDDEEVSTYSSYALADRDFPLADNTYFTKLIEKLKSYNWYVQNPAINEFLNLNSKDVKETQSNIDSIFVIGRNIYQSATGGAGSAVDFIRNLRSILTRYTDSFINHLYSGIVYEIYFDSLNQFRGNKLKSYYINEVFEVLDLERLKPSIDFIKKALKDYESDLLFLPYRNKEVKISIVFDKTPFKSKDWQGEEITYLKVNEIKGDGIDLLTEKTEDSLDLYYPDFNYSGLIDFICKTYGIPSKHYTVEIEPDIDKSLQITLGDKKLATTMAKKS